MTESLQEKLKARIRERKFVSYGDLVSFANEEGFKIGSMERKMRILVAEGEVKKLERKSKRGTNYIYAYSYEPNVIKVPAELERRIREVLSEDFAGKINQPYKEKVVKQKQLFP